MSINKVVRKHILGGAGELIENHISDALKKKKETGRSFRDCLEDSVRTSENEDIQETKNLNTEDNNESNKENSVKKG